MYRYDIYEVGVSNIFELYFEEGLYYSKFKIYFIFLERLRIIVLYEYKEKEIFIIWFIGLKSLDLMLIDLFLDWGW